ncbi:MAG: ERV/ALR sulfhydryl oxidase domain-containing protein [Benjaminiella poitrasii]|nr:MAG: ERV/ALR sulfhydryl oxidase domain-containing protein [Benjaminiella poitrasii]
MKEESINSKQECNNRDERWIAENCPADVITLGRAAWTLLHTTAAYYPDRPAPSQMESMRSFMNSFIDNYPCFSEEFKRYMNEDPIRVGNRKKLSEWLCRQHNKMNEKLGKPAFDCSLVFERWLEQGSSSK